MPRFSTGTASMRCAPQQRKHLTNPRTCALNPKSEGQLPSNGMWWQRAGLQGGQEQSFDLPETAPHNTNAMPIRCTLPDFISELQCG